MYLGIYAPAWVKGEKWLATRRSYLVTSLRCLLIDFDLYQKAPMEVP